jgi:hypothetical protein
MAICHNHGQMLKVKGNRLCNEASPAECSACFPQYSAGKFFLRREVILDHFSCVDRFLAPSRFLADRYVKWGVPVGRVRVVENPLGPEAAHRPWPAPASRARQPGGPLRLGYFGQLTPFKGIEVLLDAMALLPDAARQRVKLSLFGVDLMGPSRDWAEQQLTPRLTALRQSVSNQGPYRNEQVGDLMRMVDWIVVPSIWWENSPVVIQEAKAAGVPVLCSDVGGMREKVQAGTDGAHFRMGSSLDLAEKITAILDGSLAVDAEPQNASPARVSDIVRCYRAVISGAQDDDDGWQDESAEGDQTGGSAKAAPRASAIARSALVTLFGERGRDLPVAEQLVVALYGSLSVAQRREVCFAWDHVEPKFGLLRNFIANHWQATRPAIRSDFFAAVQQDLIRDIFRNLLDPEWYPKFVGQPADDTNGHPWGENQSIAIIGDPTSGPFQFVLCGRHLTLRADGGTSGHVAFGGPIVYGHAATGFHERPDHPGNIFWPQALAAGQLYESLDAAQRNQAMVDQMPSEQQIAFRDYQQGIPIATLGSSQREAFGAFLRAVLAPFRVEDRERVALCIERQGGIDALTIGFAAPKRGDRPIWDEWRLEGPAFVWHFRGSPHVHVWVHVADRPDVNKVNARTGAFLHPEHDPLH